MNQREHILNEVSAERDRQSRLFKEEFDNRNTVNDWVASINIRLGRMADSKERINLIQIAALAVAAVEALDRRSKFAPTHYEKDQEHQSTHRSLAQIEEDNAERTLQRDRAFKARLEKDKTNEPNG